MSDPLDPKKRRKEDREEGSANEERKGQEESREQEEITKNRTSTERKEERSGSDPDAEKYFHKGRGYQDEFEGEIPRQDDIEK